MSSPGGGARAGRSPRSSRLLRLLAADLPAHRLQPEGDGGGRFVPAGGGPVIQVRERVERRFLGRNQIAGFRIAVPAAASAGPARLRVLHRGRLRRQGVEVEVLRGGEEERSLARAVESDLAFAAAALPLDFTRFLLERSGGEWTATVELMGATYVSLALPPMRNYVRLYPDQREALLAVFDALARLLRDR